MLEFVLLAVSLTPMQDPSDWSTLLSFRPSTTVQKQLQERNPRSPWRVHQIEKASGEDTNLDYYAIEIANMPKLNGAVMTDQQLLSHVRLNINSFLDHTLASFSPYDTADTDKWKTAPLGSVIHIDIYDKGINWEDGSVVVSLFEPNRWIFSTIWTISDQNHPVSGNREFGITSSEGKTYLYTRGADRPTGAIDKLMSEKVFAGADALWKSFQRKTAIWINSNGGNAKIGTRIFEQYPWTQIEKHWKPQGHWIE